MKTINPYLVFNGTCEQAFNFYKAVFGGEFQMVARFKDMPPMDGRTIPDAVKERIMHVSLPISKETILMGSDSNPEMGDVRNGQGVSILVDTDNKDEATRIFGALSKGGKVDMPQSDTFWGAYYGQFTDKFGVSWMINYAYPKQG